MEVEARRYFGESAEAVLEDFRGGGCDVIEGIDVVVFHRVAGAVKDSVSSCSGALPVEDLFERGCCEWCFLCLAKVLAVPSEDVILDLRGFSHGDAGASSVRDEGSTDRYLDQ